MAVDVRYGEVYEAADGWRFHTIAGNHARIAWGESYKNRADCVDACAGSVRPGALVVVRKSDGEIDYVLVVGQLDEKRSDDWNDAITIGPILKALRPE